MSAIAPPFGFHPSDSTLPQNSSNLSGPELERMLDEMDMASLEFELARLQNALKHLGSSNDEIRAFMEQERQEAAATGAVAKDDPEFLLALEENGVVMAKYEATCTAIQNVIRKKRQAHGSSHYDDNNNGESTLEPVATAVSATAPSTNPTSQGSSSPPLSAPSARRATTTIGDSSQQDEVEEEGMYL
ncbi:hypothetical protein BGZ73_000153 [Actinomortierella ambigua]|nr:hypothetical protein BGZ73_000153 [Actinomortierella ambigua]